MLALRRLAVALDRCHSPPGLLMSSDPLALFRAAADALSREDWHAAAALCDPVSLAAFKRQFLESLEPAAPPREITLEDYLRHNPEMPPEVAEYHLEQHRRHADPLQRLQEELPGITSVAALLELSPVEVFSTWLWGRSARHQVEQMLTEGRISRASAQEVLEHMGSGYRYVALGALPDGERLAHVLYRQELPASSEEEQEEEAAWRARLPEDEQELMRELSGRTHPRVLTCRRQPDESWRMLAGYDFFDLGATVFQVGADGEEEDA